MRELAYAKINLCLYLGPLRTDGRHDLVSVMQSIDLADELELHDHPDQAASDEVRCAGVVGPNLAAAALHAFRELTGWDGPPQLLDIDKQIPIAAGMAGGSADAAATLRLLARRAGVGSEAQLLAIATGLGADVPSQLRPGRVLAQGFGERLTALADPKPFGVLVLPSAAQLSTATVFAEADRLGLVRSSGDLAAALLALNPSDPLPTNDLEPAARALEPTIDIAIDRALGEGATAAIVCGSGPTVIGLFAKPEQAHEAAHRLSAVGVRARAATPFYNELHP